MQFLCVMIIESDILHYIYIHKKVNTRYHNICTILLLFFFEPIDFHAKVLYDYLYQSYKGVANMDIHEGKYAWMVKIGEKGQFVIPKQARELFDLKPGDEILVLGDKERGIAILPKEKQQDVVKQIFRDIEE